MRTCEKCGIDISSRGIRSFRCVVCQRLLRAEKERGRRRKESEGRICPQCKINPVERHHTFCERCAKEQTRKYKAKWVAENRAKASGYNSHKKEYHREYREKIERRENTKIHLENIKRIVGSKKHKKSNKQKTVP